jgi:UDP-glucose 4-epimerase
VTGATGFIGRAFLRECARRGWRVLALARRPPTEDERAMPGVDWVVADLDRVPAGILREVGTLVHLAAAGVVTGSSDWDLCFRVNVTQSFALWQAAVAGGVRRFVICGSCFEYGTVGERFERIPVDAPLEPVTPYAASKAAASMLALGLAASASLQLVLLRPFHTYGEGEPETRFWPSLRRAALAGEDFPMTSGEQVRDFTPVELVAAELARHCTDLPPAGRPAVHHVGAGQARSLLEFARQEWQRFGARGQLLVGAVPPRAREVLRYVPEIRQARAE